MSVHATHREPMQAPVPGRGFLPAAEMAKRQALARMIHDDSSPFDKAQGPEHSRGTKSCSRQGRQARGAARRGFATTGSSDGGVPSFVGMFPGAGPLGRSGRGRLQSRVYDGTEAYVTQYVDRPSGEPACLDAAPAASMLVAAANSRLQQKCS